jgi:cytochrome P450
VIEEVLPAGFFLSAEFAEDPYGAYAALRARGPVHRVDFPPGATAFLVVDHEHGRAALNDPRLSKDPAHSAVPVPAEHFFGGTMLGMDPPGHTRLRGLVAGAFTARRVEALRPRVQDIAHELLEDLENLENLENLEDLENLEVRGEADLIADFAVPLPVRVICELLGVPAADQTRFREWTAVLTVPAFSREQRERRRTAGKEFDGYLLAVAQDRRRDPRDDLVSALAAEPGLGDGELLNSIALLLIAGHETTVNLIGNGMLALLSDPARLDQLRRHPELLPAAVEEFLRYDPPVERATQRIALEDLEIAGTPIPRGAWVHVSLGAAHRDPAAFPDPDALDFQRTGIRHVAFGHGIHYCLGAPLARLEGQIAIGSLIARFPGLTLAVPPEELRHHRAGSIVRGLTTLPVRLT